MWMLALVLMLGADWAAILPTIDKHILRMEIQKAHGSAICSGVVFKIDADGYAHALSAAHCYEREPTERMDVTANGRNAVVTHSNGLLDLAILRFRARDEQPITLAPTMPPPGTEVAIVGFGFGVEDVAYQFGHVSQPFNRETKSTWLNADVLFGDSGGSAIDAQGRLVGINSRIYSTGPAHITAVVTVEQIRDYLDNYEADLKRAARK